MLELLFISFSPDAAHWGHTTVIFFPLSIPKGDSAYWSQLKVEIMVLSTSKKLGEDELWMMVVVGEEQAS